MHKKAQVGGKCGLLLASPAHAPQPQKGALRSMSVALIACTSWHTCPAHPGPPSKHVAPTQGAFISPGALIVISSTAGSREQLNLFICLQVWLGEVQEACHSSFSCLNFKWHWLRQNSRDARHACRCCAQGE